MDSLLRVGNIPSDLKPLGFLLYRRIPQEDRTPAKSKDLIDPREYDGDGFLLRTPEDVKEQALRTARAEEARAAWRSNGFVEALLEAINKRHADGIIKQWAHPSANSPELVEVPSNWGLDFVAGPDGEPFGYYCDVAAIPRPRQAINEKDPSHLVRRRRDKARRDGAQYDPPPATLGADLYHKSLHKVFHRVHLSEAVFERLFAEVFEQLFPEDCGKLANEAVQPSEIVTEIRETDPRNRAIRAAMDSGARPGANVHWDAYAADIVTACGYDPNNPPWGYRAKTIQRLTRRALKEPPRQ